MIENMRLGFGINIEYDSEEEKYQVMYIYDGLWRGTLDDELNPISEEKARKITEKFIRILQEELK